MTILGYVNRRVVMCGPVRVLMTAGFVFVSVLSGPAWSQQLSSAQIKKLKASGMDEHAIANLQTVLTGNAGQTLTASNPVKAIPTKAAGTTPPPTAKQPDAITQLLQRNAGLPPSERQYSPCAGWNFILRQSWKDLGNAAGAACPDSPDKAQGAQISFADDRAANNRVVTVNGTAAVLFNSITGDVPAPLPYAVSVGAYTTVDDVSNSATSQVKSNVDTVAYGGLLNLGYNTSTGGNFFMLRGGVVQDNVKNTTAGNAVLDWSPVYTPLYINYPYHFMSWGLPIITRFEPDLVARFDSATGKNQILAFNNMQDSLRLGPEFALTILPDPGYVTGPLSRFTALLGYDIWYETYSKKQLTWFTSSLTYNLDEGGNFGIQGAYNRGQNVNTGKWTDIYTIGISGKI
jgi:hypothetical protein